ALNGEVERDVHPMLGGRRGERSQILERAQVGMDGFVATSLVANCPRRSRVVRPRDQRVVGALAVGVTNRVDRGEVDHVEAKPGQGWQLPLDPAKSVPRAREELIPGAEPRTHAIYLDRYRRREPGRIPSSLCPLDGGKQLDAERGIVLGCLGNRLVL